MEAPVHGSVLQPFIYMQQKHMSMKTRAVFSIVQLSKQICKENALVKKAKLLMKHSSGLYPELHCQGYCRGL